MGPHGCAGDAVSIIVSEEHNTFLLEFFRAHPALHDELMVETRRMLDATARIEDIVWMLHPGGAIADRRQELMADAPEETAWIIRDLPPARPGRMMVVYVGPEGVIAQHWQSAVAGSHPQA